MGILWSFFSSPTPYTALMVGLKNSGKTSLLNKLVLKNEQIIPTVGFNVETIYVKGKMFSIFDVAGGFHNFWHTYYKNADILIYVVDSVVIEEYNNTIKQLGKILKHPDLIGKPLLVCLNKQDDHNALSINFGTRALRLDTIKDRKWHIVGTSSMSGDGLEEFKDWLYSTAECL